jgi:hypothetical protein
LRERIDEVRDRACADNRQSDPACALDQRVSALEENADLKNLMNPAFVHARIETRIKRPTA